MMKSLVKYALNQLDKKGRKLIIKDRDDVEEYLERYYLVWPDSVKRERKDIPFNTFLHRFLRSDDPVFHNHPWFWYHSIILKGGYWEHTPWGTHWRGPGHSRFVRGGKWVSYLNGMPDKITVPQDLHWVEVPNPGETWTLFTRGKTHNMDWGFVPDPKTGIWYQHDVYLDMMRKNNELG